MLGISIQQKLKVPVIDQVITALKIAEGLVDMGLSQGKVTLYAKPSKVNIKRLYLKACNVR